MLTFEGYMYKKDRAREEKTYWKCTDDDCRGRAVTVGVPPDAEECRVTREHSHAPDSALIEVSQCLKSSLVYPDRNRPSSVHFQYVLFSLLLLLLLLLPVKCISQGHSRTVKTLKHP